MSVDRLIRAQHSALFPNGLLNFLVLFEIILEPVLFVVAENLQVVFPVSAVTSRFTLGHRRRILNRLWLCTFKLRRLSFSHRHALLHRLALLLDAELTGLGLRQLEFNLIDHGILLNLRVLFIAFVQLDVDVVSLALVVLNVVLVGHQLRHVLVCLNLLPVFDQLLLRLLLRLVGLLVQVSHAQSEQGLLAFVF